MLDYGGITGLAGLATTLANLWIYSLKVREVRVPLRPYGHILFMLLAIGLGVFSLLANPGYLGIIGATGAFIIAGFFLIGVTISGLPEKKIAAEVGKPFPDFQAVDSNGRPFRLSHLRGEPVCLVFFRGWW